ncbi:MAG: TatD family hydrolase [bacterium]|nr:TatD family hydrolase [bacterium]
MTQHLTYYNCHSHRKPKLANEICIRNSFLTLPKNAALPYFISAGLHPWLVEKYAQQEVIEKLENALKHPKILAIGEIGLDKFASNFDLQIRLFKLQVEIASKHYLPILIHQVGMLSELGHNLNNFNGKLVLHGYQNHIQVWEQLAKKHSIYVSIGAAILHENQKLVQTVREIPLEFLLVETDNSIVPIDVIYNKIAAIRQCSLEGLCAQIEKNFKLVFATY